MRGFSLIEVIAATALLLAITAGVFTAIQTSPDTVAVQSESADMQQRMRIAVTTMFGDAIRATVVWPRRFGGSSEDPPSTFRTDTVTFVSTAGTRTFWLKSLPASDTFQLMSWDGGTSADVPVVDHVVGLQVEYFGDGQTPIATATLAGVRSLAVTIRVQAGSPALRGPTGPLFTLSGTAISARRWAPDLEARFQVAPRNLNLDR
jgi:prepilin-type N-terminal cleavage/methylation domain-containing protein